MESYVSRGVDIMSLNYGTIPTVHSARESLWVQLRYPPPGTMTYNTIVQFKSKVPDVNFPNTKFRVIDIIGTRVVLVPLNTLPPQIGGYKWTPSTHNSASWGYTMKDWIDNIGYRNWTYHSGRSIGVMYW